MRLDINNFAKINNASIELNGITVIAGNNNTGKTTIGKALFSIFNSVYNINNKINNSRKSEIYSRLRNAVKSFFLSNEQEEDIGYSQRSTLSRKTDMALHDFYRMLRNKDYDIADEKYLIDVLDKALEHYGLLQTSDNADKLYNTIVDEIRVVNNTDDYAISLEIIERFFNSVFSHQINNLLNQEVAHLNLKIHDKELEFEFSDNKCEKWSDNFEIMHEAFFIDDPFVVDNINDGYVYTKGEMSPRQFLVNKIQDLSYDESENVISSVLAKEKLLDIESIISSIVPNKIQRKKGEWIIADENYPEPIHVDNLSAGLKSFILLKLLLERRILKEKDVLILDEPEIHLHPEWQIKYAEIIVLLQKKFDLSILVTTHSRDFFEAIDLYSKKYAVYDKCNFYLSQNIDAKIEFMNVNEDTSEIYKHLVNPSRLLDNLRFEMEEN